MTALQEKRRQLAIETTEHLGAVLVESRRQHVWFPSIPFYEPGARTARRIEGIGFAPETGKLCLLLSDGTRWGADEVLDVNLHQTHDAIERDGYRYESWSLDDWFAHQIAEADAAGMNAWTQTLPVLVVAEMDGTEVVSTRDYPVTEQGRARAERRFAHLHCQHFHVTGLTKAVKDGKAGDPNGTHLLMKVYE